MWPAPLPQSDEVESPSGAVLGRVIGVAVVAAVLALVTGVVVSITRPQHQHPAVTSASAQLPLYYMTMDIAQVKRWYPEGYGAYSRLVAIRQGTSAPVSCAVGSSCGSLVVMSKRACPTSLTLHFDVTQGVGGPTLGSAASASGAVAAREPVSLSYSYVSDQTGLVGVISDITCS
jgi:hypothetical protein